MVPSYQHTYVQPTGLSLQYAAQAQYASQMKYSAPPAHKSPQQTYSIQSVPEPETHAPHAPVATQSPAIEYTIQSSYQPRPQQQQQYHRHQQQSYSPAQIQIQQSVEYPSRQTIEYSHSIPKTSTGQLYHQNPQTISYAQYQPSVQYKSTAYSPPPVQSHAIQYQPQYQQSYNSISSPALDFFGKYNKHSSLLDSYIPSSIILEKQRSLHHNSQNVAQKLPVQTIPPPAPANVPSTDHNNGYNTIAYSTAQFYNNNNNNYNHLKRSPKFSQINVKSGQIEQPLTKGTTILTKV